MKHATPARVDQAWNPHRNVQIRHGAGVVDKETRLHLTARASHLP